MSLPVVSPRFAALLIQACAVICIACLLGSPASATSKTKILFRPKPSQGAHFWGTMVFDSAGNLYGTTQEGGIAGCGPQDNGCGTIFELTPQPGGNWAPQILHRFQGGTDGDLVYAGVIFDAAGNLYGTAAADGAHYYGTAYELSPGAGGWTETLLHSFPSQSGDGEYPSPLVFDQSGNLYGVTYTGTTPCDVGTVFELSPSPGGWTENILHCFTGDPSDGGYLDAPLIFDAAGNLYSTTYLGGPGGHGTVFELSPSGSGASETILYSFGGSQQIYPWSPPVFDKQGNLYGLIYGGIFELTPTGGGWSYSTIYTTQAGPHGIYPNWLIIGADGSLYGTAEGGSSSNCYRGGGCGAVFKLTHRTKGWQMTVLHNFSGGFGGEDPFGGLVMDQAGNLYGTTYFGGRRGCGGGCGVVFEVERTPH